MKNVLMASYKLDGAVVVKEFEGYASKNALAKDIRRNGGKVRVIAEPENFDAATRKYNEANLAHAAGQKRARQAQQKAKQPEFTENKEEEPRMPNLFENGRILKLTQYGTEGGLKLHHAEKNERFAKLKFKGGVYEYNKAAEEVNGALDRNDEEGKIWIYGTGHEASGVPSMAKAAKWMLEELGYKAKVTMGKDQAGQMVTRGVGLNTKRQSEGAYKARYVTYSK